MVILYTTRRKVRVIMARCSARDSIAGGEWRCRREYHHTGRIYAASRLQLLVYKGEEHTEETSQCASRRALHAAQRRQPVCHNRRKEPARRTQQQRESMLQNNNAPGIALSRAAEAHAREYTVEDIIDIIITNTISSSINNNTMARQ